MTLYFAYGSNMAVSQMRQRCPGCRRLGKASLPGYRWIITTRGYANIVADEHSTVEGVLYELTRDDEEALDRYEGVATGCYDKAIRTISFGEATVEALVYFDPIADEGVPRDEYVGRMARALTEANLSPHFVITSVSRFFEGRAGFDDKASGIRMDRQYQGAERGERCFEQRECNKYPHRIESAPTNAHV